MDAALYLTYKSGIAFFPIIGYLFQYKLIHQRQQIGTFSIKVCGILLLSATLKIAFYLFKHFSKALLAQALLMITVQLCLLRLCLNVMHEERYFQGGTEGNQNGHAQSFWKWKNRLNYVYTIVGAVLAIFAVSFLVRTYELTVLGQLLGYGATCIETTILVPQLLQNLKQSRVKGVSYTFVVLNTAQDLNQLLFVAVIEPQPLQFILLNGIQTFADVMLILQILFYKMCHKPIIQELIEEVVPTGITEAVSEEVYESEGKEHVPMDSQETIINRAETKGQQGQESWSSEQRLQIQIEPQPVEQRRQTMQAEDPQDKQIETGQESNKQEDSSDSRQEQLQTQEMTEGKVSSTQPDQQ